MAAKRVRASISSHTSAYFFEDFSSIEKENIFNRDYATKEILPSYLLNVDVFKECEFLNRFEEENLKIFINDAPREIYQTPVKIFFKPQICRWNYDI